MQTGMAIVVVPIKKLNRSIHLVAISLGEALSPKSIGYLNIDDVKRLMLEAGVSGGLMPVARHPGKPTTSSAHNVLTTGISKEHMIFIT